MALLTPLLMAILFIVLGTQTWAATPAASKQPWNVEFGIGGGVSYGTAGLPEGLTGRGLFSAQVGYHWPQWYLGFVTRGAFAGAGQLTIQTLDTTVAGRLSHRNIEYGLVGRRYLGGAQWYLQLGGGLAYKEINLEDRTLYAPGAAAFYNRFYINGTWLQAAVGYEFPDSPWFVRLEQTYTFYYQGKVVQTVEGVNNVIETTRLAGRPREHIFTVVVGLANLF